MVRGHLVLATLGVLLLFASARLHANTPAFPPIIEGADSAEGKPVMAKLTSIVIPKVNFEKLDIDRVIEFLTTKSKELDPEHIGVKFTLRLPPPGEKSPRRVYRQVSITLDNVPLNDLLLYIAQQTNLVFKIEKDTVVFAPFDPARDASKN